MTDGVDLDDVETAEDEEENPNHRDWLWRDEGSPDGEPERPDYDVDIGADDFADDDAATPRIPWENDDKPVGVPVESGGAGGEPASAGETPTCGVPLTEDDEEASDPESDPERGLERGRGGTRRGDGRRVRSKPGVAVGN
jgi:hypothetical protein